MFNKINVIEIVDKHLSTLKNNRTNKVHIPDVLLFIITPSFLSLTLIIFENLVNKDTANIMVTSFSIFAGLLLNLLLIVFDLIDKQGNNQEIQKALKELYFNISFCILISILLIFLLMASFINISHYWYINSLSFLVYYFLFMFMFTLLMVLKRIHKMLSIKFKA